MTTATKRLVNWFEIGFWHLAIPMLSESPAVRSAVRWAYLLSEAYRSLPRRARAIIWAAAGWFLGVSLGALFSLLLP